MPERVSRREILRGAQASGAIEYDPIYARSICQNVFNFLDEHYFRSRFVGLEKLPDRPASEETLILVSNHSGGSFPWDGMMLSSRLLHARGYDLSRACRPLTAPALSASIFMNPYFIDNFWLRAGGVMATMENFDQLMSSRSTHALVYPEGVAGIGKGFEHRYQLQKFSNSFLRMALKHKARLVPVLTVNAEYLDPYGFKSEFLDAIAHRFGMPFLPMGPLTAIAAAAPWAFYFGLPVRLTYVVGDPIDPRSIVDGAPERLKQHEWNHLRDQIHNHMQAQLNQAVIDHGRDPFHIDELIEIWKERLDHLLYILPLGWPLLFHEHERLFNEEGQRPAQMRYDNASHLFAALKNPRVAAFNLPHVGWLMLFLQRLLR